MGSSADAVTTVDASTRHTGRAPSGGAHRAAPRPGAGGALGVFRTGAVPPPKRKTLYGHRRPAPDGPPVLASAAPPPQSGPVMRAARKVGAGVEWFASTAAAAGVACLVWAGFRAE